MTVTSQSFRADDPTQKYDVAIIGSGIGSSTLAAVLARQGL